MSRIRPRGEDVRRFIVDHVPEHPSDISRLTAQRFDITRQAVNKHLQRLTAENTLIETGKTRSRSYKLAPLVEWRGHYPISASLAEDIVWTQDVKPVLGPLPGNALSIWHYGFTEMFNNAIDHSGGTRIFVSIRKTAVSTEMVVSDNGVGIFKKIQKAMNLLDERHAILELSKGKLTTDPKKHTGEGIFFTSRSVDRYDILSGGVSFGHTFGKTEDWLIERDSAETDGTFVLMRLHNHTARMLKKIFDQFSSGEDYGFNKTVVPVKLAKYGGDQLISRSQAKRLLARVELFKVVMFDFTGVDTIGQAFADEIFRVFAQAHPAIELIPLHANSQVKRVIERAKSSAAPEDAAKRG